MAAHIQRLFFVIGAVAQASDSSDYVQVGLATSWPHKGHADALSHKSLHASHNQHHYTKGHSKTPPAPAVAGANFDDIWTGSGSKYADTLPNGELKNWQCKNTKKVVVIQSGNDDWGKTEAATPGYFLGLQQFGASISQTVGNHVVGKGYKLAFKCAYRNLAGDVSKDMAMVQISINGVKKAVFAPESSSFSQQTVTYIATTADVEIKFEEAGPDDGGDRTLFLDEISIENDPNALIPTVVNGGFENGFRGNNYEYAHKLVSGLPNWTPSHEKVLFLQNGSPSWGKTPAAQGGYYIGLQESGAYITQTISNHVVGKGYVLVFEYAYRNLNNNAELDVANLQVTIDGENKGAFAPSGSSFSEKTVAYVASKADISIKFANAGPSGDRTLFLDGIYVKEDTPAPTANPTPDPTPEPTAKPTAEPTTSPTEDPCEVTLSQHFDSSQRPEYTGHVKVLKGTGKHSLGDFAETSSVKVAGPGCVAFGYQDADCQGDKGNGIASGTTYGNEAIPGIVGPSDALTDHWGCNDCVKCVFVELTTPAASNLVHRHSGKHHKASNHRPHKNVRP